MPGEPKSISEDLLLKLAEKPELLSAITNSLFGVSEQFSQLGSNASTFGSQLDSVTKKIQSSNGLLQGIAKDAGVSIDTKVIDYLDKIVGNQMRAADNALKLQKGFMDLSASTGTLSEVYQSAGENLQNVGSIINSQIDYLMTATEATGQTFESTVNYYSALGRIPQALKQVTIAGSDSNTSISGLTAVMRLAHGTSRDTKDIISDLSNMYSNLGISGESALTFTARFSEISNKFGIQLDVVKNSLIGVTSAYKGYVDAGSAAARLTEGSAAIMNNYMQALKSTGLTGEQSSELLQKSISSIRQMTEAQKAFLSSQMGGPGGMQGAFQVDMMIREGKVQELFGNIREDLSKRFGKFVSEKEAGENQQSAAELQKQISFLTEGPYGKIASSKEDAIRLIEMFKAEQEGTAGPKEAELAKDVLASTLEKGQTIEKQTYSAITEMGNTLRRIELQGSVGALEVARKFTALGPSQLSENATAELKSRDQLTGAMKRASAASGAAAGQTEKVQTGQVVDSSTFRMGDALKEISSSLSNGFNVLVPEIQKFFKGNEGDLKKFEDEMAKDPSNRNTSSMQEIMNRLFSSKAEKSGASSVTVPQATGTTLLTDSLKRRTDEAAQAFGREAPGRAVAPRLDTIPAATKTATQQEAPMLEAKLNVQLNTKCSVCNHELEGSNHSAHLVAPSAAAK